MTIPHVLGGLKRDIEILIECLSKANVLLAANWPVIREEDGEYVLSWMRAPRTGFRSLLGAFATVEEYRNALDNGLYTIVLINGDILQFYYRYDSSGSLLEHSLSFLPCPLDLPYEDRLEDEAFGDFFDDQFAAANGGDEAVYGPANLRLRGPCRFDFDAATDERFHRAAHFHIADDDCRVPTIGPLSIGEFVGFVFTNFELEWWRQHSGIRDSRRRNLGVTLGVCEEMHIASPWR